MSEKVNLIQKQGYSSKDILEAQFLGVKIVQIAEQNCIKEKTFCLAMVNMAAATAYEANLSKDELIEMISHTYDSINSIQ